MYHWSYKCEMLFEDTIPHTYHQILDETLPHTSHQKHSDGATDVVYD